MLVSALVFSFCVLAYKKPFHFTFYVLLFLLKSPECLMDSNNIFANVALVGSELSLHFVLLHVLGC